MHTGHRKWMKGFGKPELLCSEKSDLPAQVNAQVNSTLTPERKERPSHMEERQINKETKTLHIRNQKR